MNGEGVSKDESIVGGRDLYRVIKKTETCHGCRLKKKKGVEKTSFKSDRTWQSLKPQERRRGKEDKSREMNELQTRTGRFDRQVVGKRKKKNNHDSLQANGIPL